MVSPRYKHLLPDNEGLVSGFIFDDDEVILSSQIRRTLKKVRQDSLNGKIAVGYNFTSESIELLHEHGYQIIPLREFPGLKKGIKK